jgi:centromere protein C
MDNAFEDYGQPGGGSPPQDSPQHQTSFTQMDQDGDDEEEEGNDGQGSHEEEQEQEKDRQTPLPPLGRNKGKQKAVLPDVPEEEEDVEDGIAQGMHEVGQQQYDDDGGGEEDYPEPELRRNKKAKLAKEEARRPRGKSKKENRGKSPHIGVISIITRRNAEVREGVRKSVREHYKPLEWWRGEKLVYGRPRGHSSSSGLVLVPPIREIIRIPKEPPEPLGGKRKRAGRGRSKSKVAEEMQVKIVPVENPEDGWDDETDPYCTVLNYPANDEVVRRGFPDDTFPYPDLTLLLGVAFTSTMLDPRPTANGDWSFQKVFGDAEFIAAGVLVIPPNARKPSKGTKDNTYVCISFSLQWMVILTRRYRYFMSLKAQ